MDEVDESKAVAWVREHKRPEEVFSEEELGEWAGNNGYVIAEDE